MAEPNEITDGGKTVAPETKSELPNVESPPLSPAEKLVEPVLEAQMKRQDHSPQAAPDIKPEPIGAAPAAAAKPRMSMPHIKMSAFKIPNMKIPAPKISRRNRRRAALAATIMLAAGFGAAIGAVANRAPQQVPQPPQRDAAMVEQNQALQRSVAKLNKDIVTLKSNLDSATRDSKTQIAKATETLTERIDRAVETTGSIGKPATTPAATEKAEAAPMPTPRPAIVQGWSVREAPNGRVFVENRGELYRVVPGVPLPGLGRVESIRREGMNLVVVTSKGLITTPPQSSAAIRSRPQPYPPYWQPY
jgi:hypothetical protein